ncbi:MAG: hypothetical protein CMQ43_06820 [Gammaproteobacteria bacterium]|nr:hypothetical protein [Gammaproteobacteria bacterium]
MTAAPDQAPAGGRDPTAAVDVDAAIVGGGIAGLWLANLLHARGYRTVVLEADGIGGSQTLASQGMIHGGLKYALSGNLTGASEAIAGMPERWRRCLAGGGDVDLGGLEPLSDRYYMFATSTALGRLTSFFASRTLRGRIRRLEPPEYPAAFADPAFRGVVYELNDFVLDTPDLLAALLRPVADRVYRHRLLPGEVTPADGGCELRLPGARLRARRLILTAGAGTGALLDHLGIASPRMQLRPLHQVLVRHDYPHPLYAHCLTGIRRPEPRMTITSHRDGDGWLWYLGGQIAGDGVAMSDAELADHARRELAACLPWISWERAGISTLRVDRAEPEQTGGRRPDEAFAAAVGPTVVAWPTKLSLVPDLGDKVLALLDPPRPGPAPRLELPRAGLGRVPWSRP